MNTDADVDAGIELDSIPASSYSFTLTCSRNAKQMIIVNWPLVVLPVLCQNK